MKSFAKVLMVSGVAALVGPTGVMAEDNLMGHARSEVEAVLPGLPADQLNLLVYRIPTIHQLLAEPEPVSADAVPLFDVAGMSRVELADRFPVMPSSEIDRLAVYLDLIGLRQPDE